MLLLVVVLFSAVAGASVSWDATYASHRFSQAYRVDGSSGKLEAESSVAINVPVSRLRSELSQPWTWWTGGVVTSQPGSANITTFDFYPTGRYFHSLITLGPVASSDGGAFALNGTSSGMVEGSFVVEVSPHPRIGNRSLVKLTLHDFVNRYLFPGPDLLGRSLLWAMRGELPWPFDKVLGFWGLIRKLEGNLGQRYDLLDDDQLDQWMSTEAEALVWAQRLDSSGDWPTAAAKETLDLGAVLQGDAEEFAEGEGAVAEKPKALFVQFLLTSDDESDQDHVGGWSIPSTIRLSFLLPEEEDSPLALSIEDKGVHNRQVFLQVHLEDALPLAEEGSGALSPSVRQIAMGTISPAPPGQARHFVLTLAANWTLSLAVDGKQMAAAPVVVPEELREDLYASLHQISGVGLRSDLSLRRHTVDSLLVTEDVALHELVRYFLLNRVAQWQDTFSLGSGPGPLWSAPPVSWSAVWFTVAVTVGVPLLVARLAAFDSALIPTKGLDRPLLYFRLAQFVFWSGVGTCCVALLCLAMYLLFHNHRGGMPSLAVALTYYMPEVLLWRMAVVLLAVQRFMESYLSFKTQIDRLSEKSVRVAKPLFQFEYWMWVNRVSLVADVLGTCSLLVVSLCRPRESTQLQVVGSILFAVFHEIHSLAHFRVFAEVKRLREDERVKRMQTINSASFGVLFVCALCNVLCYVLTWPLLDSLASLAEWVFFALTFLWRWTLLDLHIATEDLRLYVGRRVALGAATRCSECFRPFSQSRPRETCADCRDECCLECGTEVHMSELGSMLDMTCFFCNKCHNLLLAEVMAARTKLEARGRSNSAANSAPMRPKGLAPKRVPIVPSVVVMDSATTTTTPTTATSTATTTTTAINTSPLAAAAALSDSAVEVCRMFQRGDCTYGNACKYLHIEEQQHLRHRRSRSNTSGGGGTQLQRNSTTPPKRSPRKSDDDKPTPPKRSPGVAARSDDEAKHVPSDVTPPPPSSSHHQRAWSSGGGGSKSPAEEEQDETQHSDRGLEGSKDRLSTLPIKKKKRRGKRGQPKKRGSSLGTGAGAGGGGGGDDTEAGGTDADAEDMEEDGQDAE